jgi:short-subunit dehydrogenase
MSENTKGKAVITGASGGLGERCGGNALRLRYSVFLS